MITAPVTIADVKQTLSATSNDLGTLCKSQDINVWSRCKPVTNTSVTATSCPVQQNGSAKAEQLDDWIKSACGMTVAIATETDMKAQVSGSGEYGSMFEFVNKFFGSTKITGNTHDAYVSVATLDKINSPYRLVDFNNYDPSAVSFFNFGTDKDSDPNLYSRGTYDISCFLRMSADSTTQLRPEDLLGELGSLSSWKLRIEAFYVPLYTKAYYDIDLLDSSLNRTYAIDTITVTRYAGFPPQLAEECHLTAYFYNTTTDEAIIFPPTVSTKLFTLNLSHRSVNIKAYYNGDSWHDMSVVPASIYSNQIRIQADVEETDTSVSIGETSTGRIRCVLQLTSGGYTTRVEGFACTYNGSNAGSWAIPTSTTSGEYQNIYMQFSPIERYSHTYGDRANITFEYSEDSGNTWEPIGGFPVTLYFN